MELHRLPHECKVQALCVHKGLLYVGGYSTIQVYDSNFSLMHTLRPFHLACLVMRRDDLCVGNYTSGTINIVDTTSPTYALTRTLREHKETVENMFWHGKSMLLFSASWDKTVRVWNEAYTCVQVLTHPGCNFFCTQVLAFDDVLLTSPSVNVWVWNIQTWENTSVLSSFGESVMSMITWNSDLLFGCGSGRVYAYDRRTLQHKRSLWQEGHAAAMVVCDDCLYVGSLTENITVFNRMYQQVCTWSNKLDAIVSGVTIQSNTQQYCVVYAKCKTAETLADDATNTVIAPLFECSSDCTTPDGNNNNSNGNFDSNSGIAGNISNTYDNNSTGTIPPVSLSPFVCNNNHNSSNSSNSSNRNNNYILIEIEGKPQKKDSSCIVQ